MTDFFRHIHRGAAFVCGYFDSAKAHAWFKKPENKTPVARTGQKPTAGSPRPRARDAVPTGAKQKHKTTDMSFMAGLPPNMG